MIMGRKIIEFLEAQSNGEVSSFESDVIQRRVNTKWLKWSRSISLKIVDYMQENGLNRNDMAQILDVTPQYISKILSGKVNFSLKTIAEIEEKLNFESLVFSE